ncbi:MAG: energy transducer TonB [Bacteroidales bacterium]|nr:energy transducer TonB [Bacteroidales bacterium]
MINKVIAFMMLLALMSFGTNLKSQDIAPEPVAGKSLTSKILKNHMIYPQEALGQKKSGKIAVSFTVGTDGFGRDFKVAESFDDECGAEAVRLVKMIEWKPATSDSKPVEYQMSYTVDFSAKQYAKAEAKSPRPTLPRQSHPAQRSNKVYKLEELHTSPRFYFENPEATIGGYLRTELKYPDQAKQFEIQGTVKMSFIVETDGRASNIVIENSVGGGCDNEAVRLLQNLLWTPGVKNDSLVRTRMTQEITFKIGESNYFDGNAY